MPGTTAGGAGMAGGMEAMLMKLLGGSGDDIGALAAKAAMKSAPPQIGPGPGGVIAPGAFAGVMDPNVGAVPAGVGAAIPPMGNPAQGMTPQQMMQATLTAQQAGVLGQMGDQPVQYPGAASFGRPGQIAMQPAPFAPAAGAVPRQMSLGQLLG